MVVDDDELSHEERKKRMGFEIILRDREGLYSMIVVYSGVHQKFEKEATKLTN